MGVRDDDVFYLVFYLANVVKVWDEDIHSVHALARKAHADIYDDRARIGLKYWIRMPDRDFRKFYLFAADYM